MTYTRTITVPLPHAQALERIRQALADQGFGILTEIDVKATFNTKLGPEAGEAVGDYVILGACNPALASEALAGAWVSCRATSWSGAAPTRTRPRSRPLTRKPWCSSVVAARCVRSPTTPATGCH